MRTCSELRAAVAAYTQRHPASAADAAALVAFLARTATADIYRRDNFDGHVTASAFVVDVTRSAVLLIHHAGLDRWLRPGGHVEVGDGGVLAAALREVEEEVGIPAADLRLLGDAAVPFDVDTHRIPANARRGEPAHDHHDVRWAWAYEGDGALALEEGAVREARWVSLGELGGMDGFGVVAGRLGEL